MAPAAGPADVPHQRLDRNSSNISSASELEDNHDFARTLPPPFSGSATVASLIMIMPVHWRMTAREFSNLSPRPELALKENCMSKLSAVVEISNMQIHG